MSHCVLLCTVLPEIVCGCKQDRVALLLGLSCGHGACQCNKLFERQILCPCVWTEPGIHKGGTNLRSVQADPERIPDHLAPRCKCRPDLRNGTSQL